MNVMQILYELGYKLLQLAQGFYNFLFYPINVLGITFTGWQLLGGTGLIIILVAVLVKYIVPLI